MDSIVCYSIRKTDPSLIMIWKLRWIYECISKIADAAGGADELIERVRALSDISKAYTSFSGNDDIKDSKVRFIYKTESIG